MSEGLYLVLAPGCAFLLTLLLVPLTRHLAIRLGCVALPTEERWHKRSTPSFGGVAFFVGFLPPALWFAPSSSAPLPLFLVAAQMFALGIYDDLRRINPATKLMGQIIAAATAVFFGYSLRFFGWPPLDALLTGIWIVGLTNAINLLDNMDGLAGGVALIATFFLAFLGDLQHTSLILALAGAIAGFLVYNFHPASIFMGDAGSLFLGSMLSLLTLQARGQASNILSLVAVPTLILLVPIIDTALVMFTRILRGQPISQGGKDHTSHRLVSLGLTETKAVLLLYCMAALSGASALFIEKLSYTLSISLVPLVILALALFTVYLAQVEIVSAAEGERRAGEKKLPALFITLTYKRRLLEVLLDASLIAFVYYLAFMLRFDFHLEASHLSRYLMSLPLILSATYVAFFAFGIYRGVWRYTALEDVMRMAKGTIGGTLLGVVAVFGIYGFAGYSRGVFILYALLLLLGMAASRLSFGLFGLMLSRQRTTAIPVLVYGAGDGGEAVVRECRKNPKLGYRPMGFLDDDPRKQGRAILGLPVVGGVDSLAEILRRERIHGLIISSPSILASGNADRARALCAEKHVWVRRLWFEFVEELCPSSMLEPLVPYQAACSGIDKWAS
jgi:UDP-GlcNAc:undecaprenyl-phosphate/decaprenyl-phosphate GlcNAc-1-phosphate transferase